MPDSLAFSADFRDTPHMRKGRSRYFFSVAMLGTLLATVHCGAPAGGDRSCVYTSGGATVNCLDFGAGVADAVAMSSCVSPGGSTTVTYSATAACPTANRVGSCAVTNSGGTITYRSYAPTTTAGAQMSCTMSGMVSGTTAVFTPN